MTQADAVIHVVGAKDCPAEFLEERVVFIRAFCRAKAG
jgi:hypothetical protein